MQQKVGRISKSFGTHGELQIVLFDTFPEVFDVEEPLFVFIDKLAVPLFCRRFERRGQRGAVVEFDDFGSEKRTSELIGLELFREEAAQEREVLDPDAEELDPEALIGFRAVIEPDTEGILEEYIDGENPLFVLSLPSHSEVYIPVVDEFITEIDVDQRVIHFLLPDGLVDVND
ncbi:MAG: hypothetical protein PHV49_05600 [Alistipes sp.]|nr:hypothetical protein [Alistipes sp.]